MGENWMGTSLVLLGHRPDLCPICPLSPVIRSRLLALGSAPESRSAVSSGCAGSRGASPKPPTWESWVDDRSSARNQSVPPEGYVAIGQGLTNVGAPCITCRRLISRARHTDSSKHARSGGSARCTISCQTLSPLSIVAIQYHSSDRPCQALPGPRCPRT